MPGYRQILIDGQDFTDDVLSDQAFAIELSRDQSTGTVVYAITSDLSLTGDAYEYILSRFVPKCFSCQEKIALVIVPNCCELVLMFELLVEGVTLDYKSCSATITGLQVSEAARAFKYLESNVWWQDKAGNLIFNDHAFPEVVYFKEPTWWQRLTMIFRNFNNSRYHYYHVCPFLSDIMEWNAGKAGLNFASQSILLAYPEYQRTCILYAQNREGPNVRNSYSFIRENFPIETLLQLLEKLKPVFNADYRIIGDTLRFETLDFFEDSAFVIADYSEIIENGQLIGPSQVQVDATQNKAYGRFEFGRDSIDTASNRMHYYFSDLIEWNPTGMNECLRGELDNTVDLGSIHIIADEGYWKLRADENLRVMDRIADDNRDAKLYMTTGTAALAKLLVMPADWPAQTGFANTPEMRWVGNVRETCWQLSFREDEPDGLYQRFHVGRNPANKSSIELGDIEFQPDDFCTMVNIIQEYGTEVAISTPWGKGIPETVEMDFGRQTITLTAVVVTCTY